MAIQDFDMILDVTACNYSCNLSQNLKIKKKYYIKEDLIRIFSKGKRTSKESELNEQF